MLPWPLSFPAARGAQNRSPKPVPRDELCFDARATSRWGRRRGILSRFPFGPPPHAAMADTDTATDTLVASSANTVKVEDIGPAKKRLTITIPAAALAAKLEESYGALMMNAVVPGFRKGKAPRGLLEKRFGESIRLETKSTLLGAAYTSALEEHKIRPVTEPEVDAGDPRSAARSEQAADLHRRRRGGAVVRAAVRRGRGDQPSGHRRDPRARRLGASADPVPPRHAVADHGAVPVLRPHGRPGHRPQGGRRGGNLLDRPRVGGRPRPRGGRPRPGARPALRRSSEAPRRQERQRRAGDRDHRSGSPRARRTSAAPSSRLR
jgi:hypothetical protein